MSKKRKEKKSQKRKAKKDHVLFVCSWGEQKAAKPTQEKAKDESIS
jgi:hypothetical protein